MGASAAVVICFCCVHCTDWCSSQTAGAGTSCLAGCGTSTESMHAHAGMCKTIQRCMCKCRVIIQKSCAQQPQDLRAICCTGRNLSCVAADPEFFSALGRSTPAVLERMPCISLDTGGTVSVETIVCATAASVVVLMAAVATLGCLVRWRRNRRASAKRVSAGVCAGVSAGGAPFMLSQRGSIGTLATSSRQLEDTHSLTKSSAAPPMPPRSVSTERASQPQAASSAWQHVCAPDSTISADARAASTAEPTSVTTTTTSTTGGEQRRVSWHPNDVYLAAPPLCAAAAEQSAEAAQARGAAAAPAAIAHAHKAASEVVGAALFVPQSTINAAGDDARSAQADLGIVRAALEAIIAQRSPIFAGKYVLHEERMLQGGQALVAFGHSRHGGAQQYAMKCAPKPLALTPWGCT